MERTTLHGTDISVSRLSLGTWAFGDDPMWGAQDEKASIDTVSASLDHGIDFIDSAEGYSDGRSEEVLGRALKGRRDKAVIATKVYSDRSRDGVVKACEGNLKRLQTDYIDAYYIHWPSLEIPVAELMEGLDRLLQAGKIRAAGICNAGPFTLSELEQIKGKPVLSLHQIPFSLFWRACEYEVLPKTRALGATGVAYSVLAQGLLTGRYASAADVPKSLHVTRFYGDGGHGEAGAETEIFTALAELRDLAKAEGQSSCGPLDPVGARSARHRRRFDRRPHASGNRGERESARPQGERANAREDDGDLRRREGEARAEPGYVDERQAEPVPLTAVRRPRGPWATSLSCWLGP